MKSGSSNQLDGWMNGVKAPLGRRGMIVEVILMPRGGMPLHDAGGMNCKRTQLLKIKAQGA